MPTKTIVACLLSAIVLLSLPRPAVAAEISELLVYPGSNCKVEFGGTPSINSSGWLVNNTKSTIYVQCPMYDNGFDFTGNVWVFDNSTTDDVLCRSFAFNPLGSTGSGQEQSTSGQSSTPMTLSFTGPDVGGTFTYRFYSCTLPPTTAIVSYRGCAIHSGGSCTPK
jgi:hypothetical protein